MSATKLILAFALFICIKTNGQVQQRGGLDALAGQFIKYIRSDTKERVFVTTDKTFYAAGETIWLKAWCLDSLSNRPVQQSKNLFLDLVDNNDSVISQLLFNIPSQIMGGSILLPGSLKEGYYWLRAYTKNILSQDSGRIFVRPVYILNSDKPDPRALSAYIEKPGIDAADTSSPQLLFFPEGGSIVAGTTAVVGFRCLSSKGKPMDVSGYVTDTRNDTVARFKTALPGTGKIIFDAYNPRKYFAHIRWKDNRELVYPLPRINQFASQLSVISQTNQAFKIRVSLGDSLYKKNKETYIMGVSRDSLCFAANGTDMYEVSVPKDNFPKGKATLVLFNDLGQIVSERAIYMDKDNTNMVVSPDKQVYGPREKVNLDIKISGKDKRPLTAFLSVSVTDERATGKPLEQDQLAGILLNEPDKQFSPEESDLLMLTEKPSYTAWKFGDDHIATASLSVGDSNLLSLKGRIITKKNEPLRSYIVNLISQDKAVFKIDTTDNDGRFQIHLPDYDDGTQFNLKLTSLKGQGQEGGIILDKFDFPQFNTPRWLKKGLDQYELTIVRNYKTRLLEDTSFYAKENGSLKPVIVKNEKEAAVSYDKSKRVSNFSYIITADHFNNGDQNAVFNAIKNVPGFVNSGVSSFSIMPESGGGTTFGSAGVAPLVIMDGVILSISEDLTTYFQTIDATNIDFIEVLKGPEAAAYGMQGAGGVILINTINKRKEITQINSKGLSTIYPKGYAKQSDFRAPDYDKKEIKKSSAPDLRSTIYWNGKAITDNTGKASISFYTADVNTTYAINVTAVALNGFVFSKRIEVKRQ